ncbi:MAG: endoglucanase [Oscillospiraceae bacterium]|nr:endoglucanase [Oscillospiraceae bacterium]
MKKKLLAAFVAAITLTSLTAGTLPSSAASAYDVDVTVDMNGTRKSISPYIYGINDAGYLDSVDVNVVRQGGNRYSAYNWENNYSNAGSDWKNSSDTFLTNGYSEELAATPGACALHLSDDCVKHNVPYKMATIQMAGYASADKDGEVTEAAPSPRWKQVKATKNAAFSLTPDTTDDYVYMDEYVNYLVNKLGDASTATGINGYNLDNEPGLWNSTHSLMHPDQTTYAEMVEKSTEYASAIKAVDPKAEVFGLALFGFGAYTQFVSAPDADNSYNWFISYYLDKMADAEKTAGKRLIDAIDVHYYSEAMGTDRVTNCNDNTHEDCIEARVQAPRTLYENGYIENSWIGQWGQQYLPILPNIQASIKNYYPGTKLAMTEYNFGGGDHVSGAVAEADALGAFAANDVYLATLWPLTSNIDYQLSAINLYTNYDGKGSSFGDTLVNAKTSDIEKATAYAAINGSDESKVTLVLTNKDLKNAQNATIQVKGDANYSSAAIYGITDKSSDIELLGAVNNIENNTFTVEIPALSVVQIEISADAFLLMGDVNADSKFNTLDVVMMQKYLLKAGTLTDWNAADMDGDGQIDIFDLARMKRKLVGLAAPTETDWSCEKINTATWKAKDGVAGKTLTCTFNGEPGYATSWGYGYWDVTAEEWVQGDDTALGNYTVSSDGTVKFSFDVPKNATSLQVQAYYYAYYDATQGESVEVDLDGLELVSMTVH